MKLSISNSKEDRLLDYFLAVAIVCAALPFSIPALKGFFTEDDLMNLYGYWKNPIASLLSNFLVFTDDYRSLGSIFYLVPYYLFGLNPFYFYIIGISVFSVNIVLVFRIILRLTENRLTTFLATSLFAIHPTIHSVLYNYGAIYELSALTFLCLAILSYLRFQENQLYRKPYWFTIFFYLVSLNAKETAVVLPAVLMVLDLTQSMELGRLSANLQRGLKRTAPFWLIAFFYTLAKTTGDKALLKNPLYQYHFDQTILDNLATYFTSVVNHEISFSPITAVFFILTLAATGILLRSRAVLFGASFLILTLLPVLPLPRNWDLFLYIPIVGFSIAICTLLVFGFDLLLAILKVPQLHFRFKTLAIMILTVLALIRLNGAMAPTIHRARSIYHQKYSVWRNFSDQLWRSYPTLQSDTVLAFSKPPFDGDPGRWGPLFLVHLKYKDPSIRVFTLPEEDERFLGVVRKAPEAHWFVWHNDRLVEKDISSYNN